MIDLHSHLLPGIDDGATDWDETLLMARCAWEDGIRTIAATPHLVWSERENRFDEVRKLVAKTQKFLEEEGVPLRIMTGTEIPTRPVTLQLLEEGRLPTFGDSRCILLEPPFAGVPPDMDGFIARLMDAGYSLLLAHPERCRTLQEDPTLLDSFLPPGVPIQLTSHSLTGTMGQRPLDTAMILLRSGRPMVISSDSHSSSHRAPLLREAMELAATVVGETYARQMVTEIPQALLEDRPAWPPPPS